ncbi:tubby-related protein 4 isoform X1 [Leptopilina heterotoma]|uniref:tubby-related protein 4 isoform X1 n=1 Tax=Leptopilina heterotoma TaxID=63436 RepID=UPI001CA8ACF6|nr:tubby-related protein 4 isoform X1 [Leptopilina heterotoma]XP_043471210.1 tubby-related protein 4 isoform X1 [Leptopilina heterotoma]
MHLHFEKNNNAKCDCNILSLSWMGKVPDELPEDEGWKLNRTNYYQEGWLATGNARGLVGVTFTTSHCRTRATELPLRANYNLRGHRSEVILVKWNEPYQKLASCDSSGVIFVWIKYEGRWSIELINDRSTPVTHFSWSHDGRMALICYRDGFVLVGSVAGQRYWSSMLNDKAIITCGIWTPDDQQVYFGTTAGQLIVMDVHGAMVSEVQLGAGVTSMAWSAEKFKMEEGEDDGPDERSYVLAVCLADGNIVMLKSFDDVSPITIKTSLKAPLHAEWSNSRKLLAIAGIKESDVFQSSPQVYTNLLKFYSDTGMLVYSTAIPYTQCQVSALTWGHNDRRLFVATGARVHAAWVSRRVGSLQLLSRLAVRAALTKESSVQQLPLPPRLRALVAALFASTIRCCVPEPRDLRRFVSRPPPGGGRLHCTMLRHAGEPAPCYTLYLEYLGGLVPLLKGRRTSKIRPEFVIFDPQSQGSCHFLDYNTSQYPVFSDGSDTERDTADLCGSPRNRRKNRRRREEKYCEETDDLAYVDTLPEHARLVEVTSNIWGTKFKIHGLADSIPANLGQVTYRTSLLHLQPRQMTLVITELRDDLPAGPDPSFNPNLFSEDEEETFQEPQSTSRNSTEVQPPPIAPMTPRATRLSSNRPKSQISNQFLANESLSPALARAESYEDEFPYGDLQEIVICDNVKVAVNNTYRTPPRHNAPRCCDVPTLQSPKNAVAPTQTLIATSNPSTDYTGSIQRVKTALADQQTNLNIKKELENNKINDEKLNHSIISTSIQNGQLSNGTSGLRSQNSLLHSLSTSSTINQPIYLNGSSSCSNGGTSSIQASQNFVNSKNSLNSGTVNNSGKIVGTSNGSISPTCCHQTPGNSSQTPCQCNSKRKDGNYLKFLGKANQSTKFDECKYIDEEVRLDFEGLNQQRVVHRTPTVMSIGPLCSADSIVRSCSVGYLDLVDAQLVPCDVALKMLRKDAPNKRLILVSRKPKKRKKNKAHNEIGQQIAKPPRLRNCGKSRSLDSSDIFPSTEQISLPPKLPEHAEETQGNGNSEGNENINDSKIVVKETIANLEESQTKRMDTLEVKTKSGQSEVCASPARVSSASGSVASSLDGLAARLKDFDESHSLPPPSPRPSTRLPRSSPSSPAPSKKGKRPASASPIRRRLLSSPLLSRRGRRNRNESSDDEGPAQDETSRSYRDLETFQKAQLRQKLKQRAGGGQKPEVVRRELVMHNKAPMWNESSQVYQLDFGGRVTQESAKNFQIEFRGKQVMQFGRIDGNAYTLDFQYPFSALQAFAVALANVTQRLK